VRDTSQRLMVWFPLPEAGSAVGLNAMLSTFGVPVRVASDGERPHPRG